MGLRTLLRVVVMVHTQVDIRITVHQLLPRNRQRMTAATAKQFAPKQIKPPCVGRAKPLAANALNSIKLLPAHNRFVRIECNDPIFRQDSFPLLLSFKK